MTREEAADYLRTIMESATLPRYQEALALAVEALTEKRALWGAGKLDRSRWKGCELCKNLICATCKFATFEYDDHPCDLCEGGSLYEKVNYCPDCGRPLTEEAWADLERRINGGTAD